MIFSINSGEPPRDTTYAEILRYIVQNCDPDYPHLPFLVGLWNCALRSDGLTNKQVKWLDPHYRLVFGKGLHIEWGDQKNGK